MITSVLASVVLLAVQTPSGPAQGPKPAAVPVDPSEDPVDAPVVDKPVKQPVKPAVSGLSEQQALETLRSYEERLSVGKPLAASEVKTLRALLKTGVTPRVRALAAAVLPWLRADEVLDALLDATEDESHLVRLQAVEGLNAAARRLEVEARGTVIARALELLDDPSGAVACATGGLMARLDPEQAAREMERRLKHAAPETWACWRRVVPLPARDEPIPPPPPEPPKAKSGATGPGPASPSAPPETPVALTGGPMFIVAASVVGFGVGGSLMGVLIPSRDTLTYSRQRTVRTREEPSLAAGLVSGAATAAALGVGAWALSDNLPPMSFDGASGVALGAAMGTVAGFGLSLATAANEPLTAGFGIGGALAGLGVGTAVGYLSEPTLTDIGFAGSVFGHGLLLGSLVTFAAVPVGFPRIFDLIPRNDFGFGMGLAAGGILGIAALGAAPLLDMDGDRLLLASGIGFASCGLTLAVTYLAVPVSVDVRQRIAAGAGAGALLLGTGIAWALLPAGGSGGGPTIGNAVTLKDGALSFGLPLPVVTADGTHVPLAGGTF